MCQPVPEADCHVHHDESVSTGWGVIRETYEAKKRSPKSTLLADDNTRGLLIKQQTKPRPHHREGGGVNCKCVWVCMWGVRLENLETKQKA